MSNTNLLDDARSRIDAIDDVMAKLFCERMKAVESVAAYKAEHKLPITDAAREKEIIRIGSEKITDDKLRPYYVNFVKSLTDISKAYQKDLLGKSTNDGEL